MDVRISCRAIADVVTTCEERGVDLTGITDGLECDDQDIRTNSASIAWSEAVVVFERIAERLGGVQAYADLLGDLLEQPSARVVRRFLSMASTPRRNYALVFNWVIKLVYPFLNCSIETTADGRIHITQEIPQNLAGSLPFMTSAVEMARRLPRVHGLPDALVEATVDSRRVDMLVRLPTRVSLWGRAQRWLRFVRSAPAFIEELIEHQEQLHQGQIVLEEALRVSQQRERDLSAEVEARQAAQDKLAERNDQLLHSQRMESIGRLAGGVAHDFNNLLTAILGYAHYLQDVTTDAEVQHGLKEIQAASERATALTRQLLTFARRQPTKQHEHELTELVRGVEGLLTRVMQGHAVVIDCPDTPIPVLCDPVQLEQVLVNLAINASDAMPTGGTLTIEVRRIELEGAAVARLIVTDTGVGMTKDVADHVFEPFFTTKGDLGTGLGLATAYGIVTEAGGTLSVTSEVGVGTRFVVDWPIGVGARAPTEAVATQSIETRRARILVIEDEPAIALLIHGALSAKGHTVHIVTCHAEALAIVTAHPIDLVVSDVMLGGERGPEVVASLPNADARQVLFITGYAEPERLTGLGQAPVLIKPFPMSTLTHEVDRLLGQGSGHPR